MGKALFDGQLLDVYFTRSFYKHILGVKVTYHDIEAVDPDYYKNLKWMLEVSCCGTSFPNIYLYIHFICGIKYIENYAMHKLQIVWFISYSIRMM